MGAALGEGAATWLAKAAAGGHDIVATAGRLGPLVCVGVEQECTGGAAPRPRAGWHWHPRPSPERRRQ